MLRLRFQELQPIEIRAKHKKVQKRLSRLSGAAFDRAYMKDMVEDHVEDVSEFRKQSRKGKDTDVKAWAAKTLPTLEHHLQMARTINQQVRGGGQKSKAR